LTRFPSDSNCGSAPPQPDQIRPAHRKQDAIEAGRNVCVDGLAILLDAHLAQHRTKRFASAILVSSICQLPREEISGRYWRKR
jgi:hypothetical protein